MIYWAYLLIAAFFEACWIYSLKFLNMKDIMGVKIAPLMADAVAWKIFIPLAGYMVFGLSNIYFLSLAMKSIPASTAFAVWMGLALIFSKVMDVVVFNETYNLQQVFFTGIVLVGIIGLKYYTKI
jgi:quaternary ammonium compound-resistance protein SugE